MKVGIRVQDHTTESRPRESQVFGIRSHAPKVAAGGEQEFTKPEDPLEGLRNTAQWHDAWLRTIALAWSDEKLWHEVVRQGRSEVGIGKFLMDHCGYALPEGLVVKVEAADYDDPKYAYTPGAPEGVTDPHVFWHWTLKHTVLTLFLPSKPQDESQAAVALATYDAVGKTFPFTCCFC